MQSFITIGDEKLQQHFSCANHPSESLNLNANVPSGGPESVAKL
jgi:hypothetical protein